MANRYIRIARLKSLTEFKDRLADLSLDLPIDEQILTAAEGSPMARPLMIGTHRIGNRWCIHPMEGWDANADGSPSTHTMRRWRNFGHSGAKWIWGGEAAAVQPDGRANPHQTLAVPENRVGLASLLRELVEAHEADFDSADDLLVGLQLTHSGRFCRPNGEIPNPQIAYHHPLLDAKFGIDPNNHSVVITDDEVERLIDNYVTAARLARDVGFRFVDIKSCHGYLLHEFLSARIRPGKFGGDFAGRTRLLKTIIARVRNEVPEMMVCCRLSVFDFVPYKTSRTTGQPMPFEHLLPYEFGFGVDPDHPLNIDLTEPLQLIRDLIDWGVVALNISGGSPYYNPHIQRPAFFPPSDGYQAPEDPLSGVARQIHVARKCKQAAGDVPVVGSGFSYLQDYLPQVAQAVVRHDWVDSVGLGRMVLSYPRMPADTLESGRIQRSRICRTFSDCTTAPRAGMISGCFPLDPYYKVLPEASQLVAIKQEQKQG